MINIHIRMILLCKQKWGPKQAYTWPNERLLHYVNCLFSLWGCVPTEPHFWEAVYKLPCCAVWFGRKLHRHLGHRKDFISPLILPVQPLKISEFSTTLFMLVLTLIGLTHELSSEPKPNRSSLFSDHADARPSARCFSPSRSLPNHTDDDLEINITDISMLFHLNSAL